MIPARLLTPRADTAAVVFARASAADRANAVRTVFATALLADGTDARDSVISAELVFIGHANILTVEVICGGLHTYRTWLFTTGDVGGHPIIVETSPFHLLARKTPKKKRILARR